MTKPQALRPVSIVFFAALALGAGACRGCEREGEQPVAMPSNTAPPPPPPATIIPVEVPPADSGAAGAGGAPKASPGGGSSLRACCAALRANAASMPPPNNGYALAAAAYCDSAVASGQDRNAIVQGVRGALKGANMPAACK
ncbi:MAG TPA: acyltransferase [Polyangiaceae bacterium]|nr:acyltransferase [Polyangiaceae bacterium]